MNTKNILVLAMFLLMVGFSFAQTNLTLNQAIELAQANSLQAQLNNNNHEIGKQNYKNQYSQLLPQINLNGNLPGYNNSISSITQPDGTIKFITVEQAYSSGNISLNQKILPTGATLSLVSGLNRFDRLSGVKTTNWQAQPLLINLSQPFLQFNSIKFSQRLNTLSSQLNNKVFIESREQLALEVTQQYFSVLIAEQNLSIASYNRQLSDTLFRLAQNKFKYGKIGEEELLQIELQGVNNSNIENTAKTNYDYQLNLLKILLNIEQPFNLKLELVNHNFALNEQNIITQAIKNRSDVLQNNIELETQMVNVKKAKLNNLPNFTFNASYGLNQQAVILQDAYRNGLPQQTASVSLNMPLLSFGGNQAKFKIAQYQFDNQKIKIQQFKSNLIVITKKQISEYNLAKINLSLAIKADTIAKKRFEIALKKYNIGVITYQDLFIAQQQKDQAQIGLFIAYQNYWIAFYALRKNTLYDIEKDKSILE